MPSVNVLRWIDGRGWIVLAGGADEDIRAQAINRSSADGGIAVIALDGSGDQMSDDVSALGAPSSYAVDVFTEDDAALERKLAEAGVIIVSSAASAEEVRSTLYGAAISGMQQAYANGAVILLEGASASAFGSWLPTNAAGLEWVEGALILIGMQNAAARARAIFDAHPMAVAIGIEAGSALALGPDGQIEPWGERQVTIALGSAYKT
ncbi:MAG: hypothetical protein IAE80_13275 [Anaerolinea sp.]|nr:hypothetical protein [Anaerolinea sp.]